MPDSDAQSDGELAVIWQGHRAYLVDLAFWHSWSCSTA